MLSQRLLAIAKLIPKGKVVLDVGTDHGYLPIYLRVNDICPKVIASDISEKALAFAKTNVKKYDANNISLVVSDGLLNIEDNFDVLTISGMGTKTIIHILEKAKNLPNNIILSSNNSLYELRKFMNKKGYKIDKEVCIKENNHYYDIISYVKGKEILSKISLLYGKSHDKDYYKYLYQKEKKIVSRLSFVKKLKRVPKLFILKIKSI